MALEHAQEYLAKVLPWPQEGDAPAYVNIHWTIDKVNPRTGKNIWTGRACRSVSEAASTVAWALRMVDTKDIYVCMSSQHEAIEKTSGRGNKYLAPVRSQENVVALKSLFLDLDAKGEDKNSYASVPEAAAALAKFIKAVDLPKPSAIVTSGGGLHVYFVLDRALTKDEWQPLAFALAEATKVHGLKCDTGCTIDSARVLRVPGTFNRKLDVPRAVGLARGKTGDSYSVERLDRVLTPFKVAIPASEISVLPRRPAIKGDSELSAGIDRGASAPVDLPSVSLQCGFIRDAINTNGAALANPLWNLTTLISTFCVNGRNEAHRMASGHSGYNIQSTDDLYDRKERERASKGLGWPSCRTISGSGATQCAGCVHSGAGKSPLNFAARPQAALLVAPPPGPSNLGGHAPGGGGVAGTAQHASWSDLPPGYKRLPSNVVCKIVIDGSTGAASDEPISNYPVYDPLIQTQPVYTLLFSTVNEVGRISRVQFPMKEAATNDGLRRLLYGQGMVMDDKHVKAVKEFFVSWLAHLQKNKSMVVSTSPFGWSLSGGKLEGFVYGGSVWTPTGDRTASVPSVVLERQYRPEGELQPWIDIAAMITSQGRPALDAILASAFAAPLMRFTGEPGILLSTYSQESGIGKTTTMRTAQAVWGHPKTAMQGTSDTHNGIMNKIGQIRVLPLYWDEIKTEEDSKRFVKIVFDLTRGNEKARSSQTGELRESGNWQTMMVSASNDSITDVVVGQTKQTLAGYYRVFEYAIPSGKGGKGQINSTDASQLSAKLDDNHGIVGLAYAKFLGANFSTVEKEVVAFDKAIGLELKLDNEERFWRVMITALLMGAKYANQLGVAQIDVPALKAFLFGVVKEMRSTMVSQPVDMDKADNISNVLAQFLGWARAKHTIKTNKIHRTAGKPPTGAIKVDASVILGRLEAIYVHIGIDDKVLRINNTFFGQWLVDNGYSKHLYMKALEKNFKAKVFKARIGAGTDYAGASEYLLEINLANSTHANFLDEA